MTCSIETTQSTAAPVTNNVSQSHADFLQSLPQDERDQYILAIYSTRRNLKMVYHSDPKSDEPLSLGDKCWSVSLAIFDAIRTDNQTKLSEQLNKAIELLDAWRDQKQLREKK
ncbi:hypothetical protein [Photobacterium damselae]|uniref:hypothetical protein n=1 Tax=Photobacterium damselae TaxID=38293 RepID=UPI001F43D87B|nr:hypothetical protein [Photobacterium damselae]UKA04792.1 hypothetical protein IHC89_21355 [Photobacterium damselae subsp. damselae]